MLKLYCPSCGNSNDYVSKKPEFCSQCGKSLHFSSIAYKPTTKPIIKSPIQKSRNKYEPDDEEPFDEELPENPIDSSEFEIDTIKDTNSRTGITFGELKKQNKTGFTRDIEPVNLTKEEILDNFQKIAKTSKKVIEDIPEN